MTQAMLEFDTRSPRPGDRVGFQIGWDHAHHGLVPPAELLLEGTAVSQGWQAGRAVFGHRTLGAPRHLRQWLHLRLRAWREEVNFELQQLTPNHLAHIEVMHCPVTRLPLGGTAGSDQEPVLVRLREDAGYVAGNVAMMSRAAARARAGLDAAQLLALAERMAREGQATHAGLQAAAWARLATLTSLAVEQPHLQAARVPLRALPPNQVRVLNPVQGLQVLLTLRLAAPGWSRRASAVADRLPDPALRHDFNLFVGALAARLMGIPADATARELRWGQEDAWADARVQRRWQLFVGQLSEAQVQTLLHALAASGVGGLRSVASASTSAPDGGALPAPGRLLRSPRRQRAGVAPGWGARPPQDRLATMSPGAS